MGGQNDGRGHPADGGVFYSLKVLQRLNIFFTPQFTALNYLQIAFCGTIIPTEMNGENIQKVKGKGKTVNLTQGNV